MLTGSKVMANYVVLYISGDLELDLGPILTNFLLFQLEDRPDVFGKFQGDCSMIVDARAHTDKLTNTQTHKRNWPTYFAKIFRKVTNKQTELTNILCEIFSQSNDQTSVHNQCVPLMFKWFACKSGKVT